MRTAASRTMARLGVLSEREFRWFFLGHVTSVLGTSMAPVALTFAVLGAGGNASQVGLVLMAQAVPLAAGMLAGGVVGDRLPRKVVMLTADLLRWASQSLLAVLLLMGSPSLGQFMALAAVLGLGSAFFIPAEQAIIPQVADAERLQDANALWSMAKSLGQTVGPALAGVLVAATGPASAIAVDAATYGVSAVFLSRLRAGKAAQAVRASVVSELRDGWREFRSRSWLWTTVAQIAAFNMLVMAPFMVLGAVIAETELGGATSWGTILAAEGAGSICGGLIMLRVRPIRPVFVATVGTFGFALPLALLALRAPTTAVAAGSFVAGIGLGVWAALWYTALQRQTTPETLARVSSYAAFGAVAFHPLGYAIAGPLSTLLGVTTTLWLAAAWVIVTGCLVLAVPSVRNLKAPRRTSPPRNARAASIHPLRGERTPYFAASRVCCEAATLGGMTDEDTNEATSNRVPNLDDATREALGSLSEALETVERARGHLYAFHQLCGTADFTLERAVTQLADAGHTELARRLETELLGRNVLDGRWSYQVVEEYDDTYWSPFRAWESTVRGELADGHRHVHEAALKESRRSRGYPHHEAAPTRHT